MTDGDYCIRLLDHPNTKIRGSVHIDEDGYANIYINPRISTDQQLKTLDHEMRHIQNDDAYNNDHIKLVENRAAGIETSNQSPLQKYYDRGLHYYGLKQDDPLWDNLFSVWYFRYHKDRYVGVFDKYTNPTKRKASIMIKKIFED